MATPATVADLPTINNLTYVGYNWNAVLVPSAAYTAAPTIRQPLSNYSGTGILVHTDITLNAGSAANVTVSIYNYDRASDKYFLLLASTALTAVATNTLTVYPGATPSANAVANNVLTKQFKVDVVHGNSNPITYTIGISVFRF